MREFDFVQLTVVSRDNPRKLLGVLSARKHHFNHETEVRLTSLLALSALSTFILFRSHSAPQKEAAKHLAWSLDGKCPAKDGETLACGGRKVG
ncbi:MAG: hypothetical protein ACAI34_09635 [Verrucomicrobium sp.]